MACGRKEAVAVCEVVRSSTCLNLVEVKNSLENNDIGVNYSTSMFQASNCLRMYFSSIAPKRKCPQFRYHRNWQDINLLSINYKDLIEYYFA